jgi:hypothetical protein
MLIRFNDLKSLSERRNQEQKRTPGPSNKSKPSRTAASLSSFAWSAVGSIASNTRTLPHLVATLVFTGDPGRIEVIRLSQLESVQLKIPRRSG